MQTKKKKITQSLQNCIGPTIRTGWEILCLSFAGFFMRGSKIKSKKDLPEIAWIRIVRDSNKLLIYNILMQSNLQITEMSQ